MISRWRSFHSRALQNIKFRCCEGPTFQRAVTPLIYCPWRRGGSEVSGVASRHKSLGFECQRGVRGVLLMPARSSALTQDLELRLRWVKSRGQICKSMESNWFCSFYLPVQTGLHSVLEFLGADESSAFVFFSLQFFLWLFPSTDLRLNCLPRERFHSQLWSQFHILQWRIHLHLPPTGRSWNCS